MIDDARLDEQPKLSDEELEALPISQYLLLETLAGRARSGERVRTLPKRSATRKALDALCQLGLVGWKHGVVEGSYLAWLTDAGRESTFGDDYEAPLAAELRSVRAQLAATRESLELLLSEHEPTGPTITGIPLACPSCYRYDPCMTKRYAIVALAVGDTEETQRAVIPANTLQAGDRITLKGRGSFPMPKGWPEETQQ